MVWLLKPNKLVLDMPQQMPLEKLKLMQQLKHNSQVSLLKIKL